MSSENVAEPPAPSKGAALLATAFFFALVVGVSAVDGLSHFFFPHEPSKFLAGEFKGRESGDGFWGGAPLREVETKLEEHSLAGARLRSYWSELMYAGLRHTRGTVVPGRDGWFYVASTLERRPHAPIDIPVCAGWVEAAEVGLRSRDVGLVVALVPSKVSIYPEFLPPTFEPPAPFYDELRDSLRDRGAWVVDLQELFLKDRDEALLFRRDDTHWSLEGSWRAAERIATEVKAVYPPFEPRITPQVEREERTYSPGDLLRMADFRPEGWLAQSLRQTEDRRVVKYDSPNVHRQVYLTGDSFAVTGYLGSYLSALLETDMGDVSVAGKGLTGSLGQALEGLARNTAHDVRLMIWAFVQRQVREDFATCYDPLMGGLAALYEENYRELVDLTDVHAGKPRTAGRARGYVLPGNGTSALRVTTDLPAPRRAGVLGWFARGPADRMPGRELPAGPAVTHLPAVAPGFLRGTALSIDGNVGPAQLSKVALVTAYQSRAPLGEDALARTDRGWHVNLPEPVRADGTHALGIVLQVEADKGTGRLFDGEGNPITDEFTVEHAGGRVLCVLPLAPPDPARRRGTIQEVELQLDGLGEVKVLRAEWMAL